jgi:hypothetical protein
VIQIACLLLGRCSNVHMCWKDDGHRSLAEPVAWEGQIGMARVKRGWPLAPNLDDCCQRPGGLSETSFTSALQKRMEATVLMLKSGSYSQRVQAEYLKEVEERGKKVFAKLAGL